MRSLLRSFTLLGALALLGAGCDAYPTPAEPCTPCMKDGVPQCEAWLCYYTDEQVACCSGYYPNLQWDVLPGAAVDGGAP